MNLDIFVKACSSILFLFHAKHGVFNRRQHAQKERAAVLWFLKNTVYIFVTFFCHDKRQHHVLCKHHACSWHNIFLYTPGHIHIYLIYYKHVFALCFIRLRFCFTVFILSDIFARSLFMADVTCRLLNQFDGDLQLGNILSCSCNRLANIKCLFRINNTLQLWNVLSCLCNENCAYIQPKKIGNQNVTFSFEEKKVSIPAIHSTQF